MQNPAFISLAALLGGRGLAPLSKLCFLLLGTASALPAQERIPSRARDVELRGLISQRNRQIQAEVRAFVATPFGRIPVTGRGTLTYTCSGEFTGMLDYNAIIRLLAHLKGIDLVRSIDGRVSFQRPVQCKGGPDIALRGRALTDSLTVRGAVIVAADSIAFAGTLWFDGFDHHGIVASVGRQNRMDLTFTMGATHTLRPLLTQRPQQ